MTAYARRRPETPAEPGEVHRTELVVEVEDKPGTLASVGELLGEAEVNIVAAAVFTQSGKGVIHLVVDDSDAALSTLARAGVDVSGVRDVFSVTLEDRPGELGRWARSLADAGVNISTLYVGGESAGEKELIVSVDEPSPAGGRRR
jgi:hypothetical protein